MTVVKTHRARSGTLAYAEYGDPAGAPVFYFHGSPGSRLEFSRCDRTARDRKLRVVAVDRPGMGHSEYSAYTLIEHAGDLLDLADALGWQTFVAAGVSGGAVTMYSLAAVAGSRMRLGVDLTGWAPVAEHPELARLMAPLDRIYLRLAGMGPGLFEISFSVLAWASKSQRRLVRVVRSSLSQADQEWLSQPGNARFLHTSVQEAFRRGRRGPALDAFLRYRPWGFKLRDIAVPIHLFAGTDDRFVPYPFAQWKHRQLPNSRLEAIDGSGHLAFIDRASELIAEGISAGTM
ncbi:MAG: alpha/beta hydrolase [Myxococcota bacterium]